MRRQSSSASSPANTDAAYGATPDTPTHGSDPRRKLQNLQHLPPAMQSHHHHHHHHQHHHHAWSSSPHTGRRPITSLPSRIHCVFPDDPDTVYIVRRRDVRHLPQTLPRPTLDQHQHRPALQAHGSLPQQGSERRSAASSVSDSEDRHLLMCRPFAASAVHSGSAAQQTAVPARPTRAAATAACPRGKRCPYAHVKVTASTPRHRRHVHPAGHVASDTDRQRIAAAAAASDTASNSAEDSSPMCALRRVGSDGNIVDVTVVLAVACLASPNPAGDPIRGDDTTLSWDAANDGSATVDPAPASDPSAASVSPRPSPTQGAAPAAASSANTSDGCYRHTDDAHRNQDEDDTVPASSTFAVEPRRGVPPGRPRNHNDNRANFDDRVFFIHRTAVLPTRPIYELYTAAASGDAPPQEPPLLTTETTLPPSPPARPPTASAVVDHAAASKSPPLLHHCAHWLRTGVCDFGADCRFVHSLVGLGAATPAEALAAVGESVPQPVHRGRRRFPFQHDPYDANTSSFRAASSADE